MGHAPYRSCAFIRSRVLNSHKSRISRLKYITQAVRLANYGFGCIVLISSHGHSLSQGIDKTIILESLLHRYGNSALSCAIFTYVCVSDTQMPVSRKVEPSNDQMSIRAFSVLVYICSYSANVGILLCSFSIVKPRNPRCRVLKGSNAQMTKCQHGSLVIQCIFTTIVHVQPILLCCVHLSHSVTAECPVAK